MVILFSGIFLDEVLGLSLLAGCGLIVGSIVLLERSKPEGTNALARRDMIEGLALGVGSIVFMGIAVVVVKPVIERADLLEHRA